MSSSKKGQSPAGSTTTTSNSAPWAPQQPYLQTLMSQAQDLYSNNNPTYYPGSTYAGLNNSENKALGQTEGLGTTLDSSPLTQDATNFSNQLESGHFLNNNPASNSLSQQASANPYSQDLNLGDSGVLHQQASGGNLPGSIGGATSALGSFANGSQTDPYLNSLSQSVMSQVVPGIQSQFINGGGLSSPDAAYATSQGATAALAPVLNQAMQQEQGNQLSAAGTLGNLGISQGGLQQSAASAENNQLLSAEGLNTQAANDLGSLYNTGVGQQVQGEAIMPSTLQSLFAGPNAALQAGQVQQANQQNQINANIQKYNYNTMLPYQQLAQFEGGVTGNYGGSSSTTSPYFENQSANVLTGGLGGAMLGNSLLGAGGLGLSGGMASGLGAGLGVLMSI